MKIKVPGKSKFIFGANFLNIPRYFCHKELGIDIEQCILYCEPKNKMATTNWCIDIGVYAITHNHGWPNCTFGTGEAHGMAMTRAG